MNRPSEASPAEKPVGDAAATVADAAERGGVAEERGGDPACWLRRVCQQCGSMADAGPPTTCPVCHAELPAG